MLGLLTLKQRNLEEVQTMAKSEYEYAILSFGSTLSSSNDATIKIAEQAEKGWDVQQIFTGGVQGETPQTFALLRSKREK
jgi:hypothetical protein